MCNNGQSESHPHTQAHVLILLYSSICIHFNGLKPVKNSETGVMDFHAMALIHYALFRFCIYLCEIEPRRLLHPYICTTTTRPMMSLQSLFFLSRCMCLSADACMCAAVRSNKIETKYAEKTELQQANYSKWTEMK